METRDSRQRQQDTILVTGSNGLIGYAVAKRLAGDYPVAGFQHHEQPAPPPSVDAITADMTSDESVRRALETVRQRHGDHIASVIHLAAYYDFSGKPSHLYEDLTVKGTERLLRGLQAFQVEQFIFSSTMLVYAPSTPEHPIDESWPVEPKWDYPKSKVRTEEVIRAERGNIPVVILRIAGVYDDLCHSVPLAHQIQRIYERQLVSHLYPGDMTHGQSFLHLDDLVDLYGRLVRRRKELPRDTLLLAGEPVSLSYDELQREIGQLIHGENWETRQIPKEVAKAGAWIEDELPFGEEPFIKPWMIDLADDDYTLDISRARTMLGWEPKHRLRDALPRMIAALKADPAAFYKANKLDMPRDMPDMPTRDARSPTSQPEQA